MFDLVVCELKLWIVGCEFVLLEVDTRVFDDVRVEWVVSMKLLPIFQMPFRCLYHKI